MKKGLIFLLAAVLLIGASPVTQANPTTAPLSADQASEVLQKIAGDWVINLSVWDQKNEKPSAFKGISKIFPFNSDNIMREQFEIPQPDGTTLTGDGYIRYSHSRKCFEFAQVTPAGNREVLMIGKYSPQHNTILFLPATKSENRHSKPSVQWRYVFFEDGSFTKVVHELNAQGNYAISSYYHYNQASTAEM
ncbi:DUF1579 family protein [Pontibacter harenae]|uniref:DUF1579 family protein n=1 Tax=Pontibacter harenae TaxID=2894083 RepID=UPI001E4EDF3C|nr:DUF1579 family protein [Pontibacter harenae]MCC9167680.1 DUF1579 family protein [Pontibacter harenae]